ncbi:MAG TPA: hypothetical protein VHX37_13415 [Acidobacteriaceae bacterium]|nr:hypothetical protein [Acidobacteriaceae bacterium]
MNIPALFSFLRRPAPVIDCRSTLQLMNRLYGIYSVVGRELGVTSHHVKQVALGRRKSAEVMAAVEREFRRIVDAEAAD